ncbi:hypothetical protein [Nocardioides alcanivorans]|uniref:hypothetical protein n=1 Tax=Nocardioides alcanivorans TaxID=2897352 RepID=UPI001F43BB02|nr:hypothetical protein [Nocardioides alcanivorans]
MASLTDDPDVFSRLETDRGRQPPCECVHEAGERRWSCPEVAEFRVTVVCLEAGCDCAVTVHLICRDCLVTWQLKARADGVQLRVRAL